MSCDALRCDRRWVHNHNPKQGGGALTGPQSGDSIPSTRTNIEHSDASATKKAVFHMKERQETNTKSLLLRGNSKVVSNEQAFLQRSFVRSRGVQWGQAYFRRLLWGRIMMHPRTSNAQGVGWLRSGSSRYSTAIVNTVPPPWRFLLPIVNDGPLMRRPGSPKPLRRCVNPSGR